LNAKPTKREPGFLFPALLFIITMFHTPAQELTPTVVANAVRIDIITWRRVFHVPFFIA